MTMHIFCISMALTRCPRLLDHATVCTMGDLHASVVGYSHRPSNCPQLSWRAQVCTDIIDDTVCNADMCGVRHGERLERHGERVSLTVRRVERVMPRLLRL